MSFRYPHPPPDKVKNLAAALVGTVGAEQIDVISNLERWECRQLDTLCFACTACGWWFAVDQRVTVGEEWFCVECAREGRR